VIDGLAARLLRRHVAELAGQDLRSLALTARARDAEVDDLHEAVLRDEQVRGRDVEVHDRERLVRVLRALGPALRVEVAHARRGLAHQLDGVLERQEPVVRDAAPAQLVELLADDVLHRDVRDAVVLVDVVHVDDVRMVEQRADAGLVEEHLHDPRIVGELGAEPLDDDLLLEAGHRGLPREIDLGHAADREATDQRVTSAERGRVEVGSPVALRHVAVALASCWLIRQR
jgi:hypothetical protein